MAPMGEDMSVVAMTVTGEAKHISGLFLSTSLRDLIAVVADAFGIEAGKPVADGFGMEVVRLVNESGTLLEVTKDITSLKDLGVVDGARLTVLVAAQSRWNDDTAESFAVLPDAPWSRFQDARGLTETLRSNENVRKQVPLIDDVLADVSDRAAQLRLSCSTRETVSKLDDDELKGILLCTHDNLTGTKAGNFYYEENKALRVRNPRARAEGFKTWGCHVFYTSRGLGKLDDVATTVYIGLQDRDFVAREYVEGLPVMLNAWTSTTTVLSKAQSFVGESGVIMKITVRSGKDISKISMFGAENEILLTPKHRFVVTRAIYEDSGFNYVELQETRKVNWEF